MEWLAKAVLLWSILTLAMSYVIAENCLKHSSWHWLLKILACVPCFLFYAVSAVVLGVAAFDNNTLGIVAYAFSALIVSTKIAQRMGLIER